MYLLDTNIVSDLRKPRPQPRLLAWISAADPETLRISAATIAEIQMGIERTKRSGDAAKAAEREEWLGDLGAMHQVVPLALESAALWGRMLESPLRDGSFRANQSQPVRTNWTLDLMIASIAIVAGLTVVTLNTKDFLRIDRHFELPGVLDPVRDRDDDSPPSATPSPT